MKLAKPSCEATRCQLVSDLLTACHRILRICAYCAFLCHSRADCGPLFKSRTFAGQKNCSVTWVSASTLHWAKRFQRSTAIHRSAVAAPISRQHLLLTHRRLSHVSMDDVREAQTRSQEDVSARQGAIQPAGSGVPGGSHYAGHTGFASAARSNGSGPGRSELLCHPRVAAGSRGEHYQCLRVP